MNEPLARFRIHQLKTWKSKRYLGPAMLSKSWCFRVSGTWWVGPSSLSASLINHIGSILLGTVAARTRHDILPIHITFYLQWSPIARLHLQIYQQFRTWKLSMIGLLLTNCTCANGSGWIIFDHKMNLKTEIVERIKMWNIQAEHIIIKLTILILVGES